MNLSQLLINNLVFKIVFENLKHLGIEWIK
jgi:hypothetical protein